MSVNKLKQYQKTQNQCGVAGANPHRLVQMLMEGVLEKIANAKGFMSRKDYANKGAQISWAIKIIGGLKESLNHEQGGEISTNLDALYDFMVFKLTEANVENAIEKLDEAALIMVDIKQGWDGIEAEAKKIFAEQPRAETA
jgi:flagellar secretion chaperone FliS